MWFYVARRLCVCVCVCAWAARGVHLHRFIVDHRSAAAAVAAAAGSTCELIDANIDHRSVDAFRHWRWLVSRRRARPTDRPTEVCRAAMQPARHREVNARFLKQ